MTNSLRALKAIRNFFGQLVRRSDGADLIEYALLGTTIALVAYLGVATVGTSVRGAFNVVGSSIQNQGAVAAAAGGSGGTTGGSGGTTGGTTGGTANGNGNGNGGSSGGSSGGGNGKGNGKGK